MARSRRLVIVDCGSGNLTSVARSAELAAEMAEIPLDIEISNVAASLANSDYIILPGQGAFAHCRQNLRALPGLEEALTRAVCTQFRRFLGICVGMQLLAETGLEFGLETGLGWLGGSSVGLTPNDLSLKIPHMGWNNLNLTQTDHPLLADVDNNAHGYFVHSFSLIELNPNDVIATTDYGQTIVAMVARNNIAGTQFHVEKSGRIGLTILRNFLRWQP